LIIALLEIKGLDPGVRAQFRSSLYLAGSNVVLNWDLTPKPHALS